MKNDLEMVGVPVTDRGTWMQLLEGRRFYPLDPRADEIFIEDIAQSLSWQIRYNGLSDKKITVAQHSVNCSWLADVEGRSPKVQLAMLMHDAAETYVSDVVRPIKVKIPDFSIFEDAVMEQINIRFKLPIISHTLMKYFDNIALSWEKRDIYPSAEAWPDMLTIPEWCPTIQTWSSEYAEERFLGLFHWLQLEVAHAKGEEG